MDETGFTITSRLQKVLAKKNSRQIHKVTPGDSKEHISFVPTISAAGGLIPPLFIFTGKRFLAGVLDGSPPGSVAAFTESGYMRANIFKMYLTHFINSIAPKRPVLLMMDGHGSHIDLLSVEMCMENGILLYALPPNTTHLLQPAEIPFKRFKAEFDKSADRYRNGNNGALLTKYNFAKIIGEAYLTAYSPYAITQAYKATGIWPLNSSAIDPARIMPSLMTEKIAEPPARAAESHSRQTKTVQLAEMERRIHELEDEITFLKSPGTASLSSILRYPLQSVKKLRGSQARKET